jgi:hypothetical protein
MVGGMAQEIKYLPYKHKALISNPALQNKKWFATVILKIKLN